MAYAGWFWELLYWLSLPVLAMLAGILVWRKRYREFPLFFWYLIVTLLTGQIRFNAQYGSASTYFYTYWTSDLATTIFSFLAVYELFTRLFPRFQKVRLYRYLFPVAASAIIIAAWLTALEAPHKRAAFLIEARVLSFILVAILAFVAALMLMMGRKWTRYDFGVAFGFALINATFLITMASRVQSHYRATSLDQFTVIGFDAGCVVWLLAFLGSPGKVSPAGDQMDHQMLDEARKWETVLKDWLTHEKR
jgi:hypothetical protein